MSTVPGEAPHPDDDARQHPQDPAEGTRDAVEDRDAEEGEPRVHPQDPAEGPRD